MNGEIAFLNLKKIGTYVVNQHSELKIKHLSLTIVINIA